jgi:hypothetical protein
MKLTVFIGSRKSMKFKVSGMVIWLVCYFESMGVFNIVWVYNSNNAMIWSLNGLFHKENPLFKEEGYVSNKMVCVLNNLQP